MTAEAFFAELQKIISSLPRPPLRIESVENCEFCDNVNFSKNVSRSFDCWSCTNCVYLYDSYLCDRCVDCDYAVENELCYECVDPWKCFNCEYLEQCDNMRDASYCYDCSNCHDVFGCVNLRNSSFCLFNRQLTEEEYREKVKSYRELAAAKILTTLEGLKKRFPLTQTKGVNNLNSSYGNYVYDCKNCYLCFDAARDENCAYLYDTFDSKGCYDMNYSSEDNLCLENYYSDHCFNCDYIIYSNRCADSAYVVNATDLKNCFGCVGLGNKQYCILNRQLTEEEYEKARAQILADISRKNLGWGNILF